MRTRSALLCILVFSAIIIISGCQPQQPEPERLVDRSAGLASATPDTASGGSTPVPPASFTLQTGVVDGRMAYVGVGGDIDGITNPDLVVRAGQTVFLSVVVGDGMPHDILIADLGHRAPTVSGRGATTRMVFTVTESQVGTYSYYCTVSGHRQAGMEGRLIVTAQ